MKPFHVDPHSAGKFSTGTRILVIHTGALGDVVLTFPILTQLASRGHAIHLLSQGKISRLALHHGIIDRGYALEESWTSVLFTSPLDPHILDWLRSFSTLLIFSRAPALVEMAASLPDQRLFCVSPRPPVGQSIHVTRFMWSKLRAQGLQLPEYMPDPSGLKHFRNSFDDITSIPGKREKIIALHPGSGSSRKNLSIECWLETAALFKGNGYTPAWVLGPAEGALEAELVARGPLGQYLWSLADLVTLCRKLEHVNGFICHDSGLSHLAAFLGLPVLALFGPSDPRRWKPWGPWVRVLRADLECRPCFETESTNCIADTCRIALTAPKIAGAWEQWERELP